MNHGIYRLVFNDECNTWVAVAEIVHGRGKKSVRSARRRVAAVVLGLAAAAAGSGSALAAPPSATQLPVPSSGVRPFVFTGAVTGGQPTTVGNAMTINTLSRTLGLNWNSFNVGSSASVTFNQPDSTSRVLNRIWDINPSQIMGKLSANGQVYLINQNGILFGAGSQVNVGGLVASALNLSDGMMNKLMNNGLPTAKGDSLEFAWDGSAAGFNSGIVMVEAGAAIRTRDGGRVVLIAPKTVENQGLIESADGRAAEAILAAGGKVILTAPNDPNLRGLLVETKSFTGKDALGNNTSQDGTVTNSGTIKLNDINGKGGVLSLAALAVNQKGIVNASKAVNLNGTTMLVSGSTETDLLTINQRGSVAQIDWGSGFNIGAGKKVDVVQSSSSDVLYSYANDGNRPVVEGMTLNLASNPTLKLANNSIVTLAIGPAVTLIDKSTLTTDNSALTLAIDSVVTLANGTKVTLGAGTRVTLSENQKLTVAAGQAMTLANNSMLTLAEGPSVTLAGASNVTLDTGAKMTLVTSPSVTLADSSKVTLADKLTVTLADGSKATLAVGSAVKLADGSKVSLASGAKMAVKNGSTMALADNSTVTLADGSSVKLADGSIVKLADSTTMKLSDGSTVVKLASDRSSIDGTLTANGQFYLINEKGINFGATAKVSAANIVASALGMNPDIATKGIFSQDGASSRSFYLSKAGWSASESLASDTATKEAERAANLAIASDQAKSAFDRATVEIAKGASINTTVDSGFALLLGTRVNQGGKISTPKGQTLIAAGSEVYLKPPFSAGLRGFRAEVNPLYVVKSWSSNKDWAIVDHGEIVNTGRIESPLGDITLSGFNITQAGTLMSTTSATANGSIHLQARDQVSTVGPRNLDTEGVSPYKAGDAYSDDKTISPDFVVGQIGGTLTLASGSITEVAIDGSSGKTIAPDQTFIASSIDAMAKKINVEGTDTDKQGAQVRAHGGRIRMMAQDKFDLTSGFAGDPVTVPQDANPISGIGVFVGDGAKLDVSGSIASKSVADLFIEVQLRGDEFANNPVQRKGKLRGQSAWVDARESFDIADLSGWTGKIAQTVEEKTSAGGTISLRSTGSVIVKQNAELDVSGGRVDFAAANAVSETRVITVDGQVYRLNAAPALANYAGLVTVKTNVAAYSEGKSAGTVELVGHSLAVDGKLKATTTPGTRQRNVGDPASDRYAIPLGGKLIIKDAGQHYTVANRDTASDAEKMAAYTQAQIAFVKGSAHAADNLDTDSQAGQRLELSQSIASSGFSRFDVQSDGRIDIPADVTLNLAPGGSFTAAGRQVYIAGDITVPSGSISLTTRDMSLAAGDFPTSLDAKFSTLVVADGATLSTAGQWINDYLDGNAATTPKAVKGGTVTLNSAYDIDLRAGSLIDVSGGGRVSTTGKLESGNAGSMAFTTGGMTSKGGFEFNNDGERRDANLFLDGTLSAYALGAGGKLEINTSALLLGETFTTDSRTWSRNKRLDSGQVGAALDAGFFNRGGFNEFKLVGRDGVTVKKDTHIAPSPISWSLPTSNYRNVATGSALGRFASSTVLHPDQRSAATKLTLGTRSLNYGNLIVNDGAYLGVSPRGSINLESWGQLTVLGTLEALGGSISLSRPAVHNDDPYNATPITFSERKQSQSIFLGAHARLLAGGTTVLDTATRFALEGGVSADVLRSQNRYKGQVLDGGRVDLDAGLGYLITVSNSDSVTDPKDISRALIDVSGVQDTLNTAKSTGNGGVIYGTQTVGSNGGRVNLAAREGMLLDGAFAADGKNGALGGVFSARLYEFKSGAGWATEGLPASMSGPRQLTVFQSTNKHPSQWTQDPAKTAAYLEATATPYPIAPATDSTPLDSATHNGKASLDLALLNTAGFGSWYIGAKDEIRFDGIINASVANQLHLDAPRFTAVSDATSLAFKAAAIQLGNSAPSGAPVAAAQTGAAKASFTAQDIGLIGNFSWNGFGSGTENKTKFTSMGEIHFDSTANSAPNRTGGRKFSGQMTATGNVEFSAARLSPSTYSDYRVDLSADPAGKISITRPVGASADVSLSAGGRLEFAAKSISQDGTVSAPLGEIVFSGKSSDGSIIPDSQVTFGADSITSVAADQTLMLGQTDQSGRLWEFRSSYWNPDTQSLATEIYTIAKTTDASASQAPAKAIRIDAAKSEIKTGARIDLSGGGDAMAWEFTPGPGGKTDVLAQSATAEPTVFAVLPSWQGRYAPQDSGASAYYNVSNPGSTKSDFVPSLKAGDQIQIATGSGLKAGSYTLLPARYALLPGAWLVSVKKSSDSTLAGARIQADGSWLVSGARTAANADGSATAYSQRPLTLEVASPATTAKRANYLITTASSFFYDTTGANLPGDAGLLSVVGRNSLSFDPTISVARRMIAAEDGRKRLGHGMEIDLAAPNLLISDSGLSPAGEWSVIDQRKLNALGASSVILGGTRSTDSDTTRIDTISSQVRVDNRGTSDGTKSLTAPEMMLTALNDITVSAGSRIDDGNPLLADGTGARKIALKNGDGAFVRVASGAQATVTRETIVDRTTGNLTLESGARVAGRSVILDATHKTDLPGKVEVGIVQSDGSRTGGAVTIGAGRINVVGDESLPADGLTLSNGSLAGFAKVDQLRLSSYSTLDLYGDATLGSADLRELDISATGIAGHGATTANAVLKAKTVRFDNLNPESGVFSTSGLGKGSLTAEADTLIFGSNATQTMRTADSTGFAIRGFDNVLAKASGDIRFDGKGLTAVDNIGGTGNLANLTLDAGRITTTAGADHVLRASGAGVIQGGGSTAPATGLGGALDIRAASLDVSGRIDVPAGTLALTATSGDLNINNKANIRATGSAVPFADTFAYAPGGKIVLSATTGNVAVNTGALVTVDGVGGDAGQLSLVARNGRVSTAAGTLRGKADVTSGKLRQGELRVDAASLSLDDLTSAVVVTLPDKSTHNSFSGLWDIRARNGNLDLAATSQIVSSQAKLAADNGNIDIAGVIDASGSKGGSIELYANRGSSAGGRVDLRAGSNLKANATQSVAGGQGTAGRGGSVTVGVSASDAINEMATGIGFEAAAGDKAAARIDVSTPSGSQAAKGKVIFSTPRNDTTVALKTLANTSIVPTAAINVVTAGGSASALTLASSMSSYETGMLAVFKAPASSSGPLTLNINSKGAKSILKADGSVMAANDIQANQVVIAVYDGSSFRLSSTGQQDTGTSAAYAVALPTKPTALTPGQVVTFQAKSANAAGTVTLTLNNDSNLKKNLTREDGTALGANYISPNQMVTAVYTGTEFRIVRDTNLVAAGIVDSKLASVNLAGDIVGAGSVALQGMATSRKSGDYTIDFKQQALLMTATSQSAAASANALRNAADPGSRLNLKYLHGIDVLATGDITVSNDWALGNAKYLGSPGILSLRAGGDININSTISDGFLAVNSTPPRNELSRDAALNSSGESWSYRFAAGVETDASKMAANPTAVLDTPAASDVTTKGSITVAANKLVRTGNGNISMAARRDITLLDLAAVYTAGVSDTTSIPGFSALSSGTATNSINAVFPTGGGDVSLAAGGSLVMAKKVVNRVVTAPDLRHINQWLYRAGSAQNVQWWARIGSFEQGVAALGGGDVRLEAGSDIKYFTAATPTSGRVPEVNGEQRPELANIQGGGDLTVRAGGAVIGGQFYADAGTLRLESESIGSNTGIALGNADARIEVKGDANLGNVFNPLMVKSDRVYNDKTTGAVTKFSSSTDDNVRLGNFSDVTALDLVSLIGDVSLNSSNTFYNVNDAEAHTLAPAKVKVAALNGDISGHITQAPGNNGQLDLLASGSIALDTGSVKQLDIPASALPGIGNPLLDTTTNLLKRSGPDRHSSVPWHQNDTEASRLIALSGDITGIQGQTNFAEFSEAVKIEAGGNIKDLNLTAQHLRSTDVSTVSAKGNIDFTVNGTQYPSSGFKVTGPGRLEVTAGGSIDLGDSKGITSNGNLENTYLPEGGSDIFVMAGSTSPDYAGFLKFLNDNALSVGNDSSPAGLRNRFYDVLRNFGREALTGGGEASYEKGRRAIRSLFPEIPAKEANIDLFYSAIKTEQGGNVNLLAPYGGITVGIATPNKNLIAFKKPSEQGLFTVRGGDMFAYVRDSFLVNQSRVFTLDGGDIMVWADQGSIDAGNGAKTVSATPPPVLVVRGGQIILDASNSVSGSGIGALASKDTTPASDMDLFAPQGAIDAGDAGLRSTGNITLGAQTILNSSNIQAGGGVSGAPTQVASSAPVATPTTPTTTENKAMEDAPTAAGKREAALGILTVEVIDGVESKSGSQADRKCDDKKKDCDPA